MVVVVLGMHKSGTTLVARMLHESGIDMGDVGARASDSAHDRSYDRGEKYEDPEADLLTKAVLLVDWHHKSYILPPVSAPLDDPKLNALTRAYIARRTAAGTDWGFKDPRVCLAYHHWRRFLPSDYRVVFVVRDPRELWRHFTKRYGVRGTVTKWKKGVRALRAWNVYNRVALDAVRSLTPDRIFAVRFDELMHGSQRFDALGAWLGVELTDVRNAELYRSTELSRGNRVLFRAHSLVCRVLFGVDTDRLWSDLISFIDDGTMASAGGAAARTGR